MLLRFLPAAIVAMAVTVAARAPAPGPDVDSTIARIGAYVEQYYGRAERIVAREDVTLQPLDSGMTFQGFPRRIVNELRVEWDPDSDEPAKVVRELVKASGPRLGPPEQPDCLDPRATSPEPLAFLLPDRRERFVFRDAGMGHVHDRAAVMIDFKPVAPEPPRVDWRGECATIDLPGHTGGRIWADPVTSEILRYDEHLIGMVDIPAPKRAHGSSFLPTHFTVQRADTSIEYAPVAFHDPDETVLLPSEIISLTVIRNSGYPRMRTTQRFSDYRRFVTETRVLGASR
jgi:hypothetical protein